MVQFLLVDYNFRQEHKYWEDDLSLYFLEAWSIKLYPLILNKSKKLLPKYLYLDSRRFTISSDQLPEKEHLVIYPSISYTK